MKIKRFVAPDTRTAIEMVREAFGPDAVILSNQSVKNGIEIVAAIDFDDALINEAADFQAEQSNTLVSANEQPEEQETANIAHMKNELNELRHLLEKQVAGLAWGKMQQQDPIKTELVKKLAGMGLDLDVCHNVIDKITQTQDKQKAWEETLKVLEDSLTITEGDILEKNKIIALLGPTGVGKTTTIAKLAARFVMRYGNRNISLITTDSYRIAAHEQLRTYGKILDISVRVIDEIDSLGELLNKLSEKSLVLIDTAGMSQRDIKLSQQLDFFKSYPGEINYQLVVSATSQKFVIQEAIQSFNRVNLDGCIITKIDETTNLMEILSVLIQHGLPISYLTNGQRVPEDLQIVKANSLIDLAIDISKNYKFATQEEFLAKAFSGGVVNVNE